MRALMCAALIATTLTGAARGLPENSASTRPLHLQLAAETTQTDWREDRCRYKNLTSRPGEDDWTTHEVSLLIRCAAGHWSVPGGAEKMLEVARCESGLDESNVYGSFRGVYQWGPSWSQAISKYAAFRERWRVSSSVWNARSNVLITARVVHAGDWGSWSCA